jgi:cytochrome c biogenesis protein CcdA
VSSPALALAAGVLTVAAPCVLPMLPVVLGASIAGRHPARPLMIAAGFTLAFATLALAFGTVTHVLGLSQETLRQAASAMLLAFGLLMVWRRPFEWLAMHAGPALNRVAGVGDGAGDGPWGGLLVGLSLGAVWTPCAGPVLGSILTLIATETAPARAALLLVSYAIGAAVPMLAIAYGGQYASVHVRRIAAFTRPLQQAFGVLIVVVALAMLLNLDTQLTLWLTQPLEN